MSEEKEAGRQSSRAHQPLHVALVVAALFVSTLVVQFLAAAQAEQDFRLAALEVQLDWNESQTLPLHRPDELSNLALVKQKLASASWLVVEIARLFVWRDVEIEQLYLSVPHDSISVGDVGFSVSQRLHFTSRQDDAGFPCIQDVIVMPGTLVPRNCFALCFFCCLCHDDLRPT